MFKKIFFIILVSIFLSNCGFNPIYSNKTISNFSIASTTFDGDRIINNYIESNLKQFKNEKFEKLFSLKISTDYKKEILTKDKTAKITNYSLINTTLIEISSNGKVIKEMTITSNKNIDNIDDEFEEEKNEIISKQNFAYEIAQQIVTELSILNDY